MDNEPRHISEFLSSAPRADQDEARAYEVAKRVADHEVQALQAEREELAQEIKLHPNDPNLSQAMSEVTQTLLSAQADRNELMANPASPTPAKNMKSKQSSLQPWVDAARYQVAALEEMRDDTLKHGDEHEAQIARAALDNARSQLNYREIVQDTHTSQ